MDLRTQRILVTGGGGFLGTSVRRALMSRGVEPARVIWPRSAACDLRDAVAARGTLASAFEGRGPTLVLHLAGFVGGLGANRRWPARFFHDNLSMAMNLVEAARALGLITPAFKFVQVGTMCSYPAAAQPPYREESLGTGLPDAEVASYGVAKLAVLQMLEAYRLEHGLRSAYVIPTGFYGPGDNTNPENSHVIGALVRKYVDAAAERAAHVVNWGTGSPTRDFVYIDDAAEGVLRAAEVLEEPVPVNLTGGEEVSIRELAERIARLAGFSGSTVWDSEKGDGQPRRSLHGGRAASVLGWTPRVGLEDGLSRTVTWYREAGEKFRSGPKGPT